MSSDHLDFINAQGERLSALLDKPVGEPRACALFAHCFTCGKDIHAAKRIAEGLTALGIAVLRFDFTGLGSSEGEFANTTFSSNVADLVAAADYMREKFRAPAILIGHSLGGAAVLAAASQVPEARAVVTIAAPSDPSHVTHLFQDSIPAIREHGEIEVALAGRPFRIRREFLDDVAEQRLTDKIAQLRKALLIFHAPSDQVVGVENAAAIFTAAKHPKSFVSLADADHLLSRRSDAVYVANVIAAWAERYLEMPARSASPEDEQRGVIVSETRQGKFQQSVVIGSHHMFADEPLAVGGMDSGPNPYDFLLAGLGACTAMTVRLYAERKALPLHHVCVELNHSKVHASDCQSCDTKPGTLDVINRTIAFEGDLDDGQREKLLEIADKCPVHRTLTSKVDIRTVERR